MANLMLRCLDVKIYGFLTVGEEAKIGVCAHEIGHLGAKSQQRGLELPLILLSVWLAGPLRYRL
jgi:hypothetical protein